MLLPMEKKCSKCETSKSLEDFPNDPKCSDGEAIAKLPNPEWEKWNEEDQKWIDNGYAKNNTRKCPLCRA